ncbi:MULTISPECIES: hypothetical protein [unclassified Shewanella]|uniref:hypothetical protein n=1 Tax=unclassified Shewanella TaxID=196818 RepID=UPI001C615DA0|nr:MULTISPECIES: hypothetical protein [unclassified Shewanella]
MRLLIAEKPQLAKILRENNLIEHDTEIVFTFGIGLWRYTIPRLSFADIPFTTPPSLIRPQSFKPRNVLLGLDGKAKFYVSEDATNTEHEKILNDLVEYLRGQMGEYKEIICAVDCDRTGYGSAKQLLDKLEWTENSDVPVHCLYLIATDKSSLESAWENRTENTWNQDSLAEKLSRQQLAKKTFDYWWNANSSVVFSELSKWSGLVASPLISKYELMLLCILADKPNPMSESEIIRLMDRWRGSGKYKDDLCQGIGSPMSRVAIFERAMQRGALSVYAEDRNKAYSLSAAGKAFVSQLHKKTFDPDLPFRINDWLNRGDYDAMSRYIRTVFGRQIRFQRNLGN